VRPTDTDQEAVAQLVTRYRLRAIPLVDGTGRPLGTTTVDDILDITHAEATEDHPAAGRRGRSFLGLASLLIRFLR